MNLVERRVYFVGQLKKLEQTKNIGSQADHFEKRAEELAAASGELLPISKTFGLLKDLKIDFKSLADLSIGDWNFRFSQLRDKYKIDPQSILNPVPDGDARSIFLNPLKQLPLKIKTALTVEWTAWVAQQIPSINDELLTVLSAVPSLRIKVDKLRNLKRSLVDAETRLPNSKSDIDSFLSDMEKIRLAWEDLAGDGIPKEVIDFLRMAGRPEGAPYIQLKTSILNWLREHKLDQTLRIRMT